MTKVVIENMTKRIYPLYKTIFNIVLIAPSLLVKTPLI